MTQPLALVLYERLLPGSQIVNRLQDLNYRVQAIGEANRLVECAEQAKPLLVLADLESTRRRLLVAASEYEYYQKRTNAFRVTASNYSLPPSPAQGDGK